LELGGGYALPALQSYFGAGWKGSVSSLSVAGATNDPTSDPNGASIEVMLDVCVAGKIAPAATLVVAFTLNDGGTNFAAGITALLNAGCDVISISWGGPEDSWPVSDRDAVSQALAACARAGVAVFAAAGDNGSGDGETGAHVDYPGSDPNCVSCGGTRVQDPVDVVWNDGTQGGATGGGYSTVFPRPAYQPVAGQWRAVPDVAGPADPQTGWNIVDTQGNPITVGGTSAVAPLWAGIWALLQEANGGKRLPLAGKWLYGLPGDCFTDITVGNNGAFAAGVGYDACTGLGEPVGVQLRAAVGSSSPPPPVTPPPPPPPNPPPVQQGPAEQAVENAVLAALQGLPKVYDRQYRVYVNLPAAEKAAVAAVHAAYGAGVS